MRFVENKKYVKVEDERKIREMEGMNLFLPVNHLQEKEVNHEFNSYNGLH